MDSKTWIQHVSGTGPKYEAKLVYSSVYVSKVWRVSNSHFDYYLPCDQYAACSAPERWVDVTGGCIIGLGNEIIHNGDYTTDSKFYRRTLKHEPFPHIIIERKEVG